MGHSALGGVVHPHTHAGPPVQQSTIPVVHLAAIRQLQDLAGPRRVQQAVLRLHGEEHGVGHAGEGDVEGVPLGVDLVPVVLGYALPNDLGAVEAKSGCLILILFLLCLAVFLGMTWADRQAQGV